MRRQLSLVVRATEAELLRLRSDRLTWLLVAGSLALVALIVTVYIVDTPTRALADPVVLRALLGRAPILTVAFPMCLGILATAGERRRGTLAACALAIPSRWPILLGKALAVLLAGLLLGVVDWAVADTISGAWLPALNASYPLLGSLALRVLWGTVAALGAFAVLGVAIGAVVRVLVPTLIGAIAWILIVDAVVPGVAPAVGRLLPGGAVRSLANYPVAHLPSVAAAAAVLAAWLVALGAAGTVVVLRTDVI